LMLPSQSRFIVRLVRGLKWRGVRLWGLGLPKFTTLAGFTIGRQPAVSARRN
jgi:hypothetical protein